LVCCFGSNIRKEQGDSQGEEGNKGFGFSEKRVHSECPLTDGGRMTKGQDNRGFNSELKHYYFQFECPSFGKDVLAFGKK
jgi:hypothetical protein